MEDGLQGWLPISLFLNKITLELSFTMRGFRLSFNFIYNDTDESLFFEQHMKTHYIQHWLRARHWKLMEHLIPLLYCKGVREYQAFVPFVFVSSF